MKNEDDSKISFCYFFIYKRTKEGSFPIHYAADTGQGKSLEFLLDSGSPLRYNFGCQF